MGYSTSTTTSSAQQSAQPQVAQGMPVAKATLMPTPKPQAQPRPEETILDVLERRAKERWPGLLHPYADEANSAFSKSVELQGGKTSVQADIEHLGKLAERNEAYKVELQSMEDALSKEIAAISEKEPDPDDLREQHRPDAQQVLDLLAEEMALDEYLQALDDLFAAKRSR